MSTESEILDLIKEKSFQRPSPSKTDLVADLKRWGDDLNELLEEYSSKFRVDMSNYLWYFHTKEEGSNVMSFLFKAPNQKGLFLFQSPG